MREEATSGLVRRTLTVTGIVQGVGFRPHVWRLAHEHGLSGFVLNGPSGVVIEVQGLEAAVERFVGEVSSRAPPAAAIADVSVSDAPLRTDETSFTIHASERKGSVSASLPREMATCQACRAEIVDPSDRRHGYPFTNCTDCGPRYTIILALPYDREFTTMAPFVMCPSCRGEYEDPADRRFHAQPNACPVCGPKVRLLDRGGAEIPSDDPLASAAAALLDGKILAVKGLGGYHLACHAVSSQATAELRHRKGRDAKPFASMVKDIEGARAVACVSKDAERLLSGSESPIVLLPKHSPDPLAAEIAPGCSEHGVMLAYTPLHHLLLSALPVDSTVARTLVMTSANSSDEPIIFRDDEAIERLSSVADLFLTHNRGIARRADDSVLRATNRGPVFLRSSRGFAPHDFKLPVDAPSLLAVGADLKSTVALSKGRRVVLSPHIGDLATLETNDFFRQTIDDLTRIVGIEPVAVACDLHPDLQSTRFAKKESGLPVLEVQHHEAHVAASLMDRGLWERTIGVAFDGFGYGEDGAVWGGEFFVGEPGQLQRAAHLRYVLQPGGDLGAKEPWRMALSYLLHTFGGEAEARRAAPLYLDTLPEEARDVVFQQLERRIASPPTSSMGRLFDAVAAIVCGCRRNDYEGQSAMYLEALARQAKVDDTYPFEIASDGSLVGIDVRPVFAAIVEEKNGGRPEAVIAARFHNTIADIVWRVSVRLREEHDVELVTLSGGTFANTILLDTVFEKLEGSGFRVCSPRRVPAGDGGLALGQIAIAATRMLENTREE